MTQDEQRHHFGSDCAASGLKDATVSGAKWIGAAQVLRQSLLVVSGLLIARWVGPGPVGVVALASSFMNFANLFKDAGTTTALLRASDPSPRLVASLFWVNALLGLGLALLLATLAWPLARVMREPLLASCLAAMALVPLVSGASAVHAVLLERSMRYRGVALVDATSAILGCGTGLVGARLGWEHWSLVAQAVVLAGVSALGSWIVSGYRPPPVIDGGEIRGVLGFSMNLTASNGLNYVQRNADNMIVQDALGTVATGLYSRAYLALIQPLQQVCAVIARISHPVLVRVRDEPDRFTGIWLRLVGTMAVASFPTCLGLVAVAPEFTRGVLGPAWAPAIPLIRIFGCMGVLQSIVTMSAVVISVRGRSDVLLRHALVMTPLLLIAFVTGVRWGLVGITVAHALAATLSGLVFVALALRIARVGWRRLWDAVKRPLLVSVTSCGAVGVAGALLPSSWPELVRLALLVGAGVVLYAAGSWTLNREQSRELLALARRR